eukprot:scpid76918/ scgid11117/ 
MLLLLAKIDSNVHDAGANLDHKTCTSTAKQANNAASSSTAHTHTYVVYSGCAVVQPTQSTALQRNVPRDWSNAKVLLGTAASGWKSPDSSAMCFRATLPVAAVSDAACNSTHRA